MGEASEMVNGICPNCFGKDLYNIVSMPNVPIYQNVPFDIREDARRVERGSLEICLCMQCNFIFNAMYETERLRYNSSYENSQIYSTEFFSYIMKLAEDISEKVADDERILEIGCGQGAFLKELDKKISNLNVRFFGFDPAHNNAEGEETQHKRIAFISEYYNQMNSLDYPADIIICRHVIEHIEDPVSFLGNIKKTCGMGRRVRLFFETPDVEWILRNQVITDFFYEHCSYFSKQTLKALFLKEGFEVLKIDEVFEGQYLWLEATYFGGAKCELSQKLEPKETRMFELAKQYKINQDKLLSQWKEKLAFWKSKGKKVAIWGAGAKGVTFVNRFDPNMEYIEAVIDINPNKQGKFISGTGHGIVNLQNALAMGVNEIILMNPNYCFEIKEMIKNEASSNVIGINLWNL